MTVGCRPRGPDTGLCRPSRPLGLRKIPRVWVTPPRVPTSERERVLTRDLWQTAKELLAELGEAS